MSTPSKSTFRSRAKRYLLAGVLTAIPIWITILVIGFLLRVLTGVASPAIDALAGILGRYAPAMAAWLKTPAFQVVLSLVLVVVVLYLLGWAATLVVGRRLLAAFDSVMHRIPLVKTIYGSVKKLLASLQQKPEGAQRVVLIDFPSPEMKSIGFVTRTMADSDTGQMLAAVYVPTTPNPTSGYLEIVPVDRLVAVDWTVDEAMTFIVSGGATAPPKMNYTRSAAPLEPPAPAGPDGTSV